MGDRETLEKICSIMRGLLLVRVDGINPSPRKGTTKNECYRALYEIQELLDTRRVFFSMPTQTNADRIRSMTDENLAKYLAWLEDPQSCYVWELYENAETINDWLEWLKQECEA